LVPGWVHIRGERSAYTNYYKKMKESEMDQWPPKFTKFELTTEGEPGTQVAFTDPRRFGRVRLVDCPGDDIRKHSPLVENGPDPVIDLDVFTLAYLEKRMKARHVPVKALLLDQTTISGIGNWVADETLYQAKLHPEQYSDDFSDEEIKKLFESIRYVCQTAVDKLGDSGEFPKHWLFEHRWGKGAKGSKLPNGEKLAHITVGGRTSCYAPAVQKKTGKVAPGVKSEMVESEKEDVKPAPKKKSRKNARDIPVSKTEEDVSPPKKKSKTQKPDPETKVKEAKVEEAKVEEAKVEEEALIPGRRRSTRLRK
jgi:formamidopyrimidine-DNA glycosylase